MRIWLAGVICVIALADSRVIRPTDEPPPRIGATEIVSEVSTGLWLPARVDTGATSCSIHFETMKIADWAETPRDNIGKRIRFLVRYRSESAWIESIVADYVKVRTSDGVERRFKVPLTLRCRELEKTVLVTLNNRQAMEYPLLLGRNFLRGDFLVDVERTAGKQLFQK